MNSGKMPIESVEPRLAPHVVPGEVAAPDDLARVARAESHAEVAQAGVLEPGREAPQGLDREERLTAALDLGARQVPYVGAVVAPQIDHVQVGRLAGVRRCGPRCRRCS